MTTQSKALRSKRFSAGIVGQLAALAVALPESGMEGNLQLVVIVCLSLSTIAYMICQTVTDVATGGRTSGNYRPPEKPVEDGSEVVVKPGQVVRVQEPADG